MQCPRCKHEKQRVEDTRPFGEQTWRKRICKRCGHIFITYEQVDETRIIYLPRRKRKSKAQL